MRRSTENLAAYEQEVRAGRVSTSSVESRVAPAAESAGGASEVKARGVATDELAARQRQLAIAEGESTQAERTMAQAMAQSAGNMRTNGALTNEFIEEAKRGSITVRELGQQVTGTIAKFGGWILAGSAVYFAFDALKFLKAGAIDATSGVTQMSRVINDLDVHKATEEISELSKEFNLPIDTVTETAFQLGKAYHNQADALLATKSALYAIKVGEIDAGTATRYLISIIQGFHLPAEAMAGLFDQLLTAQKRYAIDLPSLMQGVGRAAGAFRAAGGDVHGLIALITTLQHVSGQPGTVIGTAIQRSPHFIGTPKNESILEQFGVNPKIDAKHSIEEVYKEAIEAAQGKSSTTQRAIAEGLFGPKYGARVGSFFLQNKKLFNEVFKETGKGPAHGAAEEQLQITLEKTSEQITKIGVSLENIGLGLAQGHLLDSLGLILKLLNGSLEIVDDLVGAFDRLPQGLQTTLAYLLQASLLLKAMTRLNLGESIAGGPGATPGAARSGVAALFGHESPTAYAKQAREGFLNEERALQKELSSIRSSRYRGETRYGRALGGEKAANAELLSAQGVYPTGSPQVAEAAKRAEVARREVDATWAANYKLGIDEADVATRLATVQNSVAVTRKKIIGGLNTQATIAEAERLGYPVPAGFSKGGTKPPVVLGREPLPSQLKELEAVKQMEGRGIIPPAVGQEAEAATVAVGTSSTRITSLGTKLGGLRGGLTAMGGTMNNLLSRAGSLAFAAFTVSFIAELLDNEASKVGDEFEKISRIADNAKGRTDQLKSLQKGAQSGETFSDRLTNALTEHTTIGPIPIPTGGLGGGKGIGEERAELEAAEAENIEHIVALQKRARKEHKPVPYRFVGEIVKDIERVKKSGESRQEINEALEKYERELEHSAPSSKHNEELKAAQSVLKQVQADTASNKNLVESLQSLKSSQIGERLQATLGQLGGQEGIQFNAVEAKKLALIYQAQVQKIGSANDPKSIQELDQARQAYFSGVQQAIAGELQYSLDLARTPQDRNRAYSQALSRYRQFSTSSNSELQKQQESVAGLKRQRDALKEEEERKAEHFVGPIAPGTPKVSEALKKLDTRIKIESDKLKQLTDQQSEKQRLVRDIIQKLREEEFQANSALRGAEEGALEAQTADPIKQTEEKLRFLGKEIAQAIKVYGRDSQEVFQLITEQRTAQQQLIQNQLGLLQAKGNLASAGLLEQVPKEKAALSGPGGLLAQLRFEEAHRSAFDPKTIIELEAQVKQAEAQLAHDIIAEATAIADAKFGIREARANAASNPAQAAKIAVEKAKYDVAHAQTPLEKLSAQQGLIGAIASKRDAVANARLESIQFEASIAKISTQEEITQLETLLHTYKLSVTARRHLREQIHSLKSQLATEGQGFDLNVGDFSLPTAYDIRRAVLSGGSGSGATIHQTNSFHIENYSSDPNVVGKAIGQALGGAADSAARSAGVA